MWLFNQATLDRTLTMATSIRNARYKSTNWTDSHFRGEAPCTLCEGRVAGAGLLTWHRSITTLSCTFCHRWARNIWIREIFSVGILPCMKMPVKSSCTWKPTYTLARLIVGDHHRVKRRFGIWFRPERWAFVNFLYFIDSSKPLAFSLSQQHWSSTDVWKLLQ